MTVQQMGPEEVQGLELLPLEELEAIRKIWLEEKLEIEDRVPLIYEQVTKQPYPGERSALHPYIDQHIVDRML